MLGIFHVMVEPRHTINTCNGVVQCQDLWDEPEDGITATIANHGVVSTHCTPMWCKLLLQLSNTLVLTFNRPGAGVYCGWIPLALSDLSYPPPSVVEVSAIWSWPEFLCRMDSLQLLQEY